LLTSDGCASLLSIQASEDKSSQIAGYKAVLGTLPHHNKVLLKQLMVLLNAVRRSETSKMDASNLGAMFGPSLMTRQDTNLQDMLKSNAVVTAMINNYDALFTD